MSSLDVGVLSFKKERKIREFGVYNDRMGDVAQTYPSFEREAPVKPGAKDPKPNELGYGGPSATQWQEAKVSTIEIDCIPEMSQHSVRTAIFEQVPKGVNNLEGYWPPGNKREIRSSLSFQEPFAPAVKYLTSVAIEQVKQNNTINMYEDYFTSDTLETHSAEVPSARTLAVFRDPNAIKRAATKISWHPDGASKLAVSYSIMQFQKMSPDTPVSSYIWDVNSPNAPDMEIVPSSPLCCLAYNPRSPDLLVGGCYNGLVSFWDLRKGSQVTSESVIEQSHHDPVYDVQWIQARGNNECVSVSTDGQMLWWDIRLIAKGPIDSMQLRGEHAAYGGTALEYKSDVGSTRYLVGTEQGIVLLCDRKAKKDAESAKAVKNAYGVQSGKHHGPIYSIERNPFSMKNFLTVGDWSARVWFEDCKTPIMQTKYDGSYLTAGCWSPTRPGVFFTTKADGTLDIWDYFYKQNDPIFSTKVSDHSLCSIKVQSQGRNVALGSTDGSVTVVQISRGLSDVQNQEKAAVLALFDREVKRESNLQKTGNKRAAAEKKDGVGAGGAAKKDQFDPLAEEDEATQKLIREAEAKFYKMLGADAKSAPTASASNGAGNGNGNGNGASAAGAGAGTAGAGAGASASAAAGAKASASVSGAAPPPSVAHD